MKKLSFKTITVWLTIFMLLSLGIGVLEGQTQSPPISAPTVREGAFAMKLAEALNIGNPASETEAESMLGAAGIAPRNGWIADYPVTPDIIGELRDAVGYAAQANTISMDRDTALSIFESVQASLNIAMTPGPAGPTGAIGEVQTGEAGYPDQTIINNYYYDQGPPILTYYAPPPNYYYLYAWVPYPFWWSGFWFGGFFVLHDFHRHFREDGHDFIVSNHFNDIRAHRVFRIDPVNRFNGKTFAGIGAPRSNRFISPGVQRAPERIFNGSRSYTPPSGTGTVRPQSSVPGTVRQPSTTRSFKANPFPENRVYSQPPGAGRTFSPPSGSPGAGKTVTPPSRSPGGGRTVTPSPRSGNTGGGASGGGQPFKR